MVNDGTKDIKPQHIRHPPLHHRMCQLIRIEYIPGPKRTLFILNPYSGMRKERVYIWK